MGEMKIKFTVLIILTVFCLLAIAGMAVALFALHEIARYSLAEWLVYVVAIIFVGYLQIGIFIACDY